MNRQLIIIANDGGKKDFLAGVQVDRQCYINYFSSPEGGAWEKQEMFLPTVNGVSAAMLHVYMKMKESERHVDYWLVIFCGHGGATSEGKTYFHFQNNDKICYEDQIMKYSLNSRMLIIADSCRSIPNYFTNDENRQIYFCRESQDSSEFYRLLCRKEYNRMIEEIPINTVFRGYATQFRCAAGEFDDGTGGYYSQSLIEAAKSEIVECIERRDKDPAIYQTEMASFSWIHSQAKRRVLELTNGKQNPVYMAPRTVQPPFYIVPEIPIL